LEASDEHVKEPGRWVALPAPARDIDVAPLADVIRTQAAVREAWLVGVLKSTHNETESVTLAVAFVLEDPVGAADRPEMIGLIERLAPLTRKLGLDIGRWAFVSPLTVEYEIASRGRVIS
jgi:hypothetical protein